jgi:hypothetical protein
MEDFFAIPRNSAPEKLNLFKLNFSSHARVLSNLPLKDIDDRMLDVDIKSTRICPEPQCTRLPQSTWVLSFLSKDSRCEGRILRNVLLCAVV